MATFVKILLLCLTLTVSCAFAAGDSFSAPQIIIADGADLVFREFLIEKSLASSDFKCVVTEDDLSNALSKLRSGKCDMVLVKRLPSEIGTGKELSCKVFAETPVLVFVNSSNKVGKMKISDLQKIWNGEINQWNFFTQGNIFSIHRFAMPYNESAFLFIKRILSLKENSQHFPLNSTSQIIKMVGANPNAIGIGIFEKDLNFENIKLIQLTDGNGKNVNLNMPHTVIFRSKDKNKVENFLKVKK